MTIPFSQIPSALRLPGAFIEVDASKAGRSFDPGRLLLVGQYTAIALPAVVAMPQLVASKQDADTFFGVGSHLANMVAAVRKVDPFGQIWCLPVADAGGSAAATGTLTVTAAPTAPGVIALYIAGVKVPVAVAGTETTTTAAAAIVAAVNANVDLPVTAGNASSAVVTFTAKNKGTLGNDIQFSLNFGGPAAGEANPTSFAATLVAMASGASDPDITAALANLGDTTYDYIAAPYTDSGNLTALANFMNAATDGRWAYDKMLWGHVFTAKRGTSSTLTTLGLGRNDPHISILGFNSSPTPLWNWLAGMVAAAAIVLRNDPARPVQGLVVPGLVAPPVGSSGAFTKTTRQTFLWSGISTYTVDSFGNVYIERLISTYQTNAQSVPDDAWLAVEKTFTLMAVQRQLRANLFADFPRFKLAADGTRIAPNSATTTPSKLRAWLVAQLRTMEEGGLLQNVDAFVDQVAVEIDGNNPDRVDMLFPPSLIAQLRIFAVLSQFHTYPNP